MQSSGLRLLLQVIFLYTISSIPAFAQGVPDLRPPVFPVSVSGFNGGWAAQAAVDRGAPGEGGISAIIQDGPDGSSAGKKNVGLAVIYSLLLPGMGELYAGDYGSGKYLTAVEGALWLTLGAVDLHAHSIEDDARRYASQHAAFSVAGKDDRYFIDVSNFNSVYDYNEQVLRDRDSYKLYDPSSPDFWEWDSDLNRSAYRDQRVSADQMFNNTRFVVAAIAVNHVLSAVNAARLVISGNRDIDNGPGMEIGARILGGITRPHGIALSITQAF